MFSRCPQSAANISGMVDNGWVGGWVGGCWPLWLPGGVLTLPAVGCQHQRGEAVVVAAVHEILFVGGLRFDEAVDPLYVSGRHGDVERDPILNPVNRVRV